MPKNENIIMLQSWIDDIYHRIYPQTSVSAKRNLKLDSALNEKVAFQFVVRNQASHELLDVKVSVETHNDFSARIRRIGYVPLRHLGTIVSESEDCEGLEYVPGFVPDPLFEENKVLLPPMETHAFWIDLKPKRNIEPGLHKITVICKVGDKVIKRHTLKVKVHEVRLKKREKFPVTHWFYTDALIDWYKTDGYDEKFWKILPEYFKNMVEHGQDTILVPIFTPPLDGEKSPCQLLKVKKFANRQYVFDFSRVQKYIEIAKKAGFRYFEWSHLATQWGAEYAPKVYEQKHKKLKLLWRHETKVTSATYKGFLSQLLPAWREFLKKNGLMRKSFFHLSDEPRGEEHLGNYRAFRKILAELAPWMSIVDAVSDVVFAHEGLIDMPVASEDKVMEFQDKGLPSWVYYCCGPRGKYLNHLMDTPLAKIAMHGMLLYRFGVNGFLHWGYNFWYRRNTTDLIDPLSVNDASAWPEWPAGDPFYVYPGEKSPIDSIRWEVFSLSMQDYQLLQTLNISRNDKCLSAIENFEKFPKDADWRLNLRRELLKNNK